MPLMNYVPASDYNSYKVKVYTAASVIDIPNNYTDLQNLYDQYRIDAVTVKLVWMNNSTANGNNYVCPLFQEAIDYDDDLPPTNNTTLTQFSTFRLLSFGHKSQTTYFRKVSPKVSMSTTTANVGSTAGTVLKGSQFINTETPDVAHTGYKVYWDVPSDYQGNNINDGDMQIYVKYHLTCKLVN